MLLNRFHNVRCAKRRGASLPERLRVSARRGVTLVELMIAMLILSIVCISWLQIIGIQSARREARRREAVERLSGLMDAFMYHFKTGMNGFTGESLQNGCYRMVLDYSTSTLDFHKVDDKTVNPLFDKDIAPIGYRLAVVNKEQLDKETKFTGWKDLLGPGFSYPRWLVGKLYNESGDISGGSSKPFFTLQVCLGF